MEAVTPTGCCPPFDPVPWDGKRIHWDAKPFIRADVRAIWHVPFGIAKATTQAMDAIRTAGVAAPGMLILAKAASPWKTEIRFETTGPVSGYPFEKMSGTFVAKAFDGPWRDTAKWHAAVRKQAAEQGVDVEELYEMWTTCPKCAKAYGHNWVVILARVAETRSAAA